MLNNLININEADLDTFVYRVFNFQRLLELFVNKKNVLVKPSKWDDPFENYILKTATEAFINKQGIDLTVKDKFYGQCWTTRGESDAMWRIYSPEKNGVTVKMSIRNVLTTLQNSFEGRGGNTFIGKVNYLPTPDLLLKIQNRFWLKSEIRDEKGQAESLLFKRLEFEHEHEVRVLFRHNDSLYTSDLFSYFFDPLLLDAIQFDPRISEEMFQVYKHYLINKLQYQGTISKSKLYDLPGLYETT